jgi:hypothetical protein
MLVFKQSAFIYLSILISTSKLLLAERNLVAETGAVNSHFGDPPETTPAASIRELRLRHEAQEIQFAAANNICGYINGSSGTFPQRNPPAY